MANNAMPQDKHFQFDRAVILGATGPTGIHLSSILRSRGIRLRVVSRSMDHLKRVFSESDDECMAADATREDDVERAVDGHDVVFDCIGLPAERMGQHPDTARNLARVIRRSGLRCVQVSSYWSYLPVAKLPVNEEHLRLGGNEWVGQRRQAEDILQEAGAAILNLPDFYGPGVHTSTLQQPLREAAEGKTMNWLGPADIEREYAYVPDAMQVAADLAARQEAYGQRWIVPGAGSLTGRKAAEIASQHLDRQVKLRAPGMTTLRLVSMFNPRLRSFLKMAQYYFQPISFDGTKLWKLLGDVPVTPYSEGIGQTLSHLSH